MAGAPTARSTMGRGALPGRKPEIRVRREMWRTASSTALVSCSGGSSKWSFRDDFGAGVTVLDIATKYTGEARPARPSRRRTPCRAAPPDYAAAMFDPQVSVAGLPATIVTVGIALTLMVIGFLWIRRIFADDPEIKSFWATDRGDRRPNAALVAGLVLAGIVVALVAFVRF
jgi:hypothetical protein